MTSRLQNRRDTAANWTANNPTLAAGEIGLETDTNKYKMGTGSDSWTSLGYAYTAGSQGTTGTQGTTGPQGTTGATGIQGTTGTQGTDGTQGLTGAQGAQGIQGNQGTEGLQGLTGTQGTTGAQGTQGIQGTTGTTGAVGGGIAGFNAQTGTTYTLVVGDLNKLVTASNAAAITLTVPPSVYSANDVVNIQQIGAGQVTFAAGAGVTITSTGATSAAPKLRAQYSSASVICSASNIFTIVGDIS